MSYAKATKVPVERSRAEIERLLSKYGADQFLYAAAAGAARVAFRMKNRAVRFDLPLPASRSEDATAAEHRRRWRALVLVIKAKLEAVASGITSFEQEFYAHILLPGGLTVYEMSSKNLAEAIDTGRPPMNLLGGPSA